MATTLKSFPKLAAKESIPQVVETGSNSSNSSNGSNSNKKVIKKISPIKQSPSHNGLKKSPGLKSIKPIAQLKPMSPIRTIKPVKAIKPLKAIRSKASPKTKPVKKIPKQTRKPRTARVTKISKKTVVIIPNCQNHLMEQFKKFYETNSIPFNETNEGLAKQTEKAIYQFVHDQARSLNIETAWENPKFRDLYLSKSRSILTNLNPKSYLSYNNQTNLLEQFLKGDMAPAKLVQLTPQELAPGKWQPFIEQRIHEAKIHSQNLSIGTTDLFKCGKCKQKKCTYYQLQTRSQDEPMTTFITCTVCGNHWKE